MLEAGAPGVDAAAVTTALVGLSETAAEGIDGSSAPTAADERPLVFAHLSYDELRKAASAAPEGTPLRDARAPSSPRARTPRPRTPTRESFLSPQI